MARFYCPTPLAEHSPLDLPPGAARHVQVLRMQPGQSITLFNGQGGQWQATIEHMGKTQVRVRVDAHQAIERETANAVHLAVGMPANERMDWLIEKATELGAASIQPLHTTHSVVRLSGERAEKKVQHWQAIAIAACEQSGRNRVPTVLPVQSLTQWLAAQTPQIQTNSQTGDQVSSHRLLTLADMVAAQTTSVKLAASATSQAAPNQHRPTQHLPTQHRPAQHLLIGPEGGLTTAEEQQALSLGFVPLNLGPATLRTETAALAGLMALRAL